MCANLGQQLRDLTNLLRADHGIIAAPALRSHTSPNAAVPASLLMPESLAQGTRQVQQPALRLHKGTWVEYQKLTAVPVQLEISKDSPRGLQCCYPFTRKGLEGQHG